MEGRIICTHSWNVFFLRIWSDSSVHRYSLIYPVLIHSLHAMKGHFLFSTHMSNQRKEKAFHLVWLKLIAVINLVSCLLFVTIKTLCLQQSAQVILSIIFGVFRCYKALDETISGLVIIHCHAIHIRTPPKSQDECHDPEIPWNPTKAGTCKLCLPVYFPANHYCKQFGHNGWLF